MTFPSDDFGFVFNFSAAPFWSHVGSMFGSLGGVLKKTP